MLVAAWNEAGNIEAHIRSFLGLRYPNKELVLCAGGQDGTNELAKRWESRQVKILHQEGGGQAARLAAMSGPYIRIDRLFDGR